MNGALPPAPASLSSTKHIIYVTGPAGCGKSTVGHYLSTALNLPYLEGDDYHSAANRAKMAANHPLTDADRWDWLVTLRSAALATLQKPASAASGSEDKPQAVLVTCSALKHTYRDVLRGGSTPVPTHAPTWDPDFHSTSANGVMNGPTSHPKSTSETPTVSPPGVHPPGLGRNVAIHFLYLRVDESTLQARVAARTGHYMKADMVHSQMEALEEPEPENGGERDVWVVDTSGGKEEVQRRALEVVKAALDGERSRRTMVEGGVELE
jgi:gluconokinase